MNYTIALETKIEINVTSCNFEEITSSFLHCLCKLFEEFVAQVLLHYFAHYHLSGKLAGMLNVSKVSKKSTMVRTKFKTLFGDIWVPQIQVRVVDLEGRRRQMSITRKLLGVSPMFQIPDFMKSLLGRAGSLTSFRTGHSIVSAFTGFKCSLQSLWGSVGWHAPKIKLGLSPEGTNEVDCDGTGTPTKEGGKRGSELKKVFQRKEDGKLHLAGIAIGAYKEAESWCTALSGAIEEGCKKFGKPVIASDADQTIINTAKSLCQQGKVFFQMDKWHVFHQLKYYLWQDKVARQDRSQIIAHCFKITMLFKTPAKKRDKRIRRYISLLAAAGLAHTATYLQTAMRYFYTHEVHENKNIYTTKTERSMRTTNQRTDIGTWSAQGALNVCKIRLAYYYNGTSPCNWKKRA